jgi:hypothetical protein
MMMMMMLVMGVLDEHQINQAHQYEMMMKRNENKKSFCYGYKSRHEREKPYYLMLG